MSFLKRMEGIINKGMTTSKVALEKAKGKTKELSEKGTLKIKIMQLEKQAGKNCAQLGSKVYEILIKMNKNTVSKSTPEIKPIIQEISQIEKKIDENEALLKKL
ncbi:hypothetical protein LCGC14_3116190 [marine sediment metagenome]|uniref:Uncharacterized protein n=1 Tax=marine sediment metagenome TaxID=412755 RepID=A0A0F8WSJ5_9ZZZZ